MQQRRAGEHADALARGRGTARSSAASRKVATSSSSVAWATVPPGSPSTRQARLPGWSTSSRAAVERGVADAGRGPQHRRARRSPSRSTCSRRRVRRSRESRLTIRSRARAKSSTAPPRTTAAWVTPPLGRVGQDEDRRDEAGQAEQHDEAPDAWPAGRWPATGRGSAIAGCADGEHEQGEADEPAGASSGRSATSAASAGGDPGEQAGDAAAGRHRRTTPTHGEAEPGATREHEQVAERVGAGASAWLSSAGRRSRGPAGSISTSQPACAAATVTTRASSRLSRSCRIRSRWKAVTAAASDGVGEQAGAGRRTTGCR